MISNGPAGQQVAPEAIIDTQSLLDWQLFRNPVCARWEAALACGQWQWVATSAMRDELAHVLSRGIPGQWPGSPAQTLAWFDAHARLVPALPSPAQGLPRCTDADDQKFVDLALLRPVRWLISRDRAVLKTAKVAARRFQVLVLPPDRWTPWESAQPAGPSTDIAAPEA